jgi:dihydroorotase
MNLILKNIRLINPLNKIDDNYNILIEDGTFKLITKDDISLDGSNNELNCDNLFGVPGLFDMHVHLREPGFEYKEDIISGLQSAANGGFTGVVCMPNTNPCTDNITVVEYIKNKSKNNIVDNYISAAITKNREGNYLTEMLELNEAGVVMFTDDGSPLMRSDVMRLAFEYAAPKDLLLSQHCEDINLTKNYSMNEGKLSYELGLKGYPSVAEEIILYRDILLAEYLGNRRYHAQHLSTKGSVKLIKDAKNRGLRVTAEVTPHHLILNDQNLSTYNSNYKMNPPLRNDNDIQALIDGLVDGTIDCIATDHAPHALHEKFVELENAPNGIIGLETSLGLILTFFYHKNILSLNKIIELMSINPRKILNLPEILFNIGEKVNMTIIDLNEEWTVNYDKFKSKSKNTPFNNFNLKGKPKYIINNSQIYECNL